MIAGRQFVSFKKTTLCDTKILHLLHKAIIKQNGYFNKSRVHRSFITSSRHKGRFYPSATVLKHTWTVVQPHLLHLNWHRILLDDFTLLLHVIWFCSKNHESAHILQTSITEKHWWCHNKKPNFLLFWYVAMTSWMNFLNSVSESTFDR